MLETKQARAGRLAADYAKPIYAYTRSRTRSEQDAEDLAQDICLRVYRTFLQKEDIRDPDRFVWTIAHHALANYYRGRSRAGAGPISGIAEDLPADDPRVEEQFVDRETRNDLHTRIAYLAKTQRQVLLMHYYAGLKQAEIAEQLHLPLGTVKWHLREAKRELKNGMEAMTMNDISLLKCEPIQFERMGLAGAVGSKGGTSDFFRSKLTQNIAYSVLHKARTINEIADALGVSPVFVESEVEYLEEYGFLLREGARYRVNFLIDEPSDEANQLHNAMYEAVVGPLANDLFDELEASGLLEHADLAYPDEDRNFLMWALFFYVAACSGEKAANHPVPFEEAAVLRPDGGYFLPYATVQKATEVKLTYAEGMNRWSGPCWNGNDRSILWFVSSEWSSPDRETEGFVRNVSRDLDLLEAFTAGRHLSAEDYAYLAEMGFLKRTDAGEFELAIVHIKTRELRRELLNLGLRVREQHQARMEEWRARFAQYDLGRTPKHLHKMLRFVHQHLFTADGYFLLHSAKALLAKGKLQLPREEQRISLSVLLLPVE
ncbi:RNA polymerase sigma factor [Gorillibacterium sp. CAU 1737]|uniref:RNA polymerase sigma factor n=1 Tax=Gorillibacterium sp. CAU 1737 TaxID=3140362 RepID=UPI003261462B